MGGLRGRSFEFTVKSSQPYSKGTSYYLFMFALLAPIAIQVLALSTSYILMDSWVSKTAIFNNLDWFTWKSLEEIEPYDGGVPYHQMRFYVFLVLFIQIIFSFISPLIFLSITQDLRTKFNPFKWLRARLWLTLITIVLLCFAIIFWIPGIYRANSHGFDFVLAPTPFGIVILESLIMSIGFGSLPFFITFFFVLAKPFFLLRGSNG